MSKARAIALAVVALCLASCTTSAASKSQPRIINTTAYAHVQPFLLTAGELPSGWAVDTSGSGRVLPSSCGTDTPLQEVDPNAYAAVTFSQTANSAIELFEEIVFSKSAGSAFASVDANLNGCRTFKVVIAPSATGTLTPLSFPSYASRQAGFVLSIPSASTPSYPWEQGFIILQKGRYLVYLGYFPSTGPFTASQLDPFITLALAKVPGT